MFNKQTLIPALFLLLALAHAGYIDPITRTPLRPFAVNQNYTTDYSFSMYIPSSINFEAYIAVKFPLPYRIPSDCQVYVLTPGQQTYQEYSCIKNSGESEYLVSMEAITPGNYTLVFTNIRNPSAYQASTNFKVWTIFNQSVVVDSNEYFDAIPFLSTPGTRYHLYLSKSL